MLKKISFPIFCVLAFVISACAPKQQLLPVEHASNPNTPAYSALPPEKSVPAAEEKKADPQKATVDLCIKPTAGQLSSAYGKRKLGKKRARQHKGVDLSAKRGSPVLASASGRVVFAGKKGAYGRMVEIEHGNGLRTRYAHLDSFAVSQGDKVSAGKKLGAVGRSGRTTGPNLHFEVLLDDKHVDPLSIVPWS